MKIKGITFWEQHTEHFVLGAAAVAFIAFTAMQFLGSPNAVQVDGKAVAPGEVDPLLKQKAGQVAEKIATGPKASLDHQPLLDKFGARIVASVAPVDSLAPWATPVAPVGGGTTEGTRAFVVASAPVPAAVKVREYYDTIQPEVVHDIPALAKYVPSNPYDVNWNTVSATLDVSDLLRQYASGGSNGEAPIPDGWYKRRVDILDIVWERQELLPDGKWANQVVLDPIPAQVSYRETIAKAIDAAGRDKLLADVSDPAIRSELLRPEFYNTVSDQWIAPDAPEAEVIKAKAGEDPAISELKGKISRMQSALAAVKKEIGQLNCPETPDVPEKEKPGAAKPAGGGRAPGGGAGGPPSPTAGGAGGMRSPAADATSAAKCKKLREKAKQLQQRIDVAQGELLKIQPAEEVKKEVVAKPDDASGDQLVVWAHDLTIVPNHTYRYRAVAVVYNPVFGRKLDLPESQRPLADKISLVSKPSEWSDPITANPPLQIFITAASPAGATSGIGGGPGLGNATAEVYRFRDGRWWKSSFNVGPGDRVGSERNTPVGYSEPAPRAERKEKPEAGKPGSPKAAGAGHGGEGPAPAAGAPGEPAAAHPTAAPPVKIDYSSDWFILDILEDPAADAQELRNRTGALVMLQSLTNDTVVQVRVPRFDANNPELKRLREEVQFSDRAGTSRSS